MKSIHENRIRKLILADLQGRSTKEQADILSVYGEMANELFMELPKVERVKREIKRVK